MAAAFTNPAGGALDEARELLAQAVELDPGYAPALALAGYFEAKAFLFGRHPDGEAGKRHVLDLAERAVQADPKSHWRWPPMASSRRTPLATSTEQLLISNAPSL